MYSKSHLQRHLGPECPQPGHGLQSKQDWWGEGPEPLGPLPRLTQRPLSNLLGAAGNSVRQVSSGKTPKNVGDLGMSFCYSTRPTTPGIFVPTAVDTAGLIHFRGPSFLGKLPGTGLVSPRSPPFQWLLSPSLQKESRLLMGAPEWKN